MEQAWNILGNLQLLTLPESVPIHEAIGRWSSRDIRACHDSPPFDQSRYDGFALGAVEGTSYKILNGKVITAGDGNFYHLQKGEAIPIMTGAPLPKGTAAIVPEEACQINHHTLTVRRFPNKGDMWLKKGSNFSKGDLYLRQGSRINPMHVAFLTLDGKDQVEVYSRPIVAIISSGDELSTSKVQTLGRAKIRNSHPALIQALLTPYARVTQKMHVPDRVEPMKNALVAALNSEALITITTGGLGKGIKDLTRQVIHELGAETLFEGIQVIPIGTFSCYLYGNKIIFALPGGMIGVLLISKLFIEPFLKKIQGAPFASSPGPFRMMYLKDSQGRLRRRENKRRFIKARHWEEGEEERWVSPLDPQNDSLTDMNAFILSGISTGRNGAKVPVFTLWES